MATITSTIGRDRYQVTLQSPTGNRIIADEPRDVGGQDKGFSPKELLLSALAACTSATLRMYADRKEWPLEEIQTDIHLHQEKGENETFINRKITLTGPLDEEQKNRLLAIANACPLHKILTNPIEIESSVV